MQNNFFACRLGIPVLRGCLRRAAAAAAPREEGPPSGCVSGARSWLARFRRWRGQGPAWNRRRRGARACRRAVSRCDRRGGAAKRCSSPNSRRRRAARRLHAGAWTHANRSTPPSSFPQCPRCGRERGRGHADGPCDPACHLRGVGGRRQCGDRRRTKAAASRGGCARRSESSATSRDGCARPSRRRCRRV